MARPALKTVQEVLDSLSDEDELDLDDSYPESDLESHESDEDVDVNTVLGYDGPIDPNIDPPVVPPTGMFAGGDMGDPDNLDAGWGDNYYAPDFDLRFDNNNTGPQNIPNSFTLESTPLDFLDLFLDADFWTNVCNMTNLRASQYKDLKPNSYYAKSFTPPCVDEMKAFVGLRMYNVFKLTKSSIRCTLCTKYLCVKKGSTCWVDWHTKVEYWR
jgi:hypothetical protein